MNEYDSNRILDLVKTKGYFPTSDPSDSDCYIINTCHIREKATEKVYHDIGTRLWSSSTSGWSFEP